MKKTTFAPLLAGIDADGSFAEFEQLLVSNSGEDAFDVAIRLLAAKLEDELLARSHGSPRTFVIQDSPVRTFGAVEALFRRAAQRWPSIEFNGGLGITPEQLVRCMRPLCGWDLLATDLAHLDAVLERLVARGAKGALGQYFTPRGVVRMCVEVLNPTGPERVIDPACGSGGFLFEAVRHARQRGVETPKCLGIDFGAKALKVAALLATATGADEVRIGKGNSIDGREHAERQPDEWSGFLGPMVQGDGFSQTKRPKPWGAWHRLQCEVLLTNPPFAGTVDEPDVIAAYDSQQSQGASRKGGVGREYLFLERAVEMLVPGGRLAIVLPQGILANASAAYLRHWVMDRCRVLGVVGLHPLTFLPHTGVKTSVLFLVKDPLAARTNYPILFAISQSSGKDSSGRQTGRDDYRDITAVMGKFLADSGFVWAENERSGASDSPLAETVTADEVRENDRLDAEYYEPEIRRTYFELAAHASGRTVASAVGRNVNRFKRAAGGGDIDYVDISAVESRTGTIVPNRISAEEAPSRASSIVQPGDVLVSTVRPDRNAVALVTRNGERQMVASNGFCLLRPHGIPPELLFAYCKTEAFRSLLSRHATATMYPAVTDRDVLDLPLVLPPEDVAAEVVAKVQSGLRKLEEAKVEIRTAIETMDAYVTSTLAGSTRAGRGARQPRRRSS